MSNLVKLISAVQRFPVLYRKSLCTNYDEQKDIWERVAKKCGCNSAYEANKIWMELVKDYIEYLRDGTDFDYEIEMLFLQSHLISSVQSDSDDLDEDELQRILDSDSETSVPNQTPVNKQEIPTTSQEVKTSFQRLKSGKIIKKLRIEKAKDNTTVDSSTNVDCPSDVSTNVSGLSSLQLIFLGYAKVLQDLPLPIQIRTKHKIAQIMNEAEMSLFELEEVVEVKEK